jgi:diaminopimelate epimerase
MSHGLKNIPFVKMHGLGNDFVVIDNTQNLLDHEEISPFAKQICERRFGVGSDGLILLEKSTTAPFLMRIFNADGSESEACGNGLRCFARYLVDRQLTDKPTITIETRAGLAVAQILENDLIKINMGTPNLTRKSVGMLEDPESTFIEQTLYFDEYSPRATALSMGNPHLVLFVDNVHEVPLEIWGPQLENHPLFLNRINVHFVQVLSPTQILQRTWERGAGATLACGTGACASVVAAYITRRTERNVGVYLPGGRLDIHYQQEDGSVFMAGPATTVFEGQWFLGNPSVRPKNLDKQVM